MSGSDDRVSGETFFGGEEPAGDASAVKREVVWAGKGVGDLGSSEETVLDLFWLGEHAEERSRVTCSAVGKSGKGRGDGPKGLPTPDRVRKLQITLYRKAQAEKEYRRCGDQQIWVMADFRPDGPHGL